MSTMRHCLAGLLLLACTAPFSPAGASRVAPPAEYQAWWREVESCAGRTGRFERVEWFLVPGRSFRAAGRDVIGRWEPPHRIYLAADWAANDFVVRHEILHDLIGRAGHPFHPFVEPCALADPWG